MSTTVTGLDGAEIDVDQTPYQRVLDMIEAASTPDSPWTAKNHLAQDAGAADLERGFVQTAVDDAVSRGDAFGWHGLVAAMDVDVLRAIVEKELEADITRQVLVGNLNAAIQEVKAGE